MNLFCRFWNTIPRKPQNIGFTSLCQSFVPRLVSNTNRGPLPLLIFCWPFVRFQGILAGASIPQTARFPALPGSPNGTNCNNDDRAQSGSPVSGGVPIDRCRGSEAEEVDAGSAQPASSHTGGFTVARARLLVPGFA